MVINLRQMIVLPWLKCPGADQADQIGKSTLRLCGRIGSHPLRQGRLEDIPPASLFFRLDL